MLHASGTRLGPYEIVSALGAGGMGEVYEARDTRIERTVAIKVCAERFAERFRNEVLAVAALNHPRVCALYDVGPDYLVMEYVEGRPLRGPLPEAKALRLAREIADALEHAHRHGVVHRDLKPSNILVTRSGVKVLDFGLAKRLDPAPAGEHSPTLTEAGAVVGTPRYMAPEQIEGKPADERADIFAFGLVLYEMLTGRHAFEGKSAASAMAATLEREPTPISAIKPDTSPALEQVVLTCLAKDPSERWQSVRELKHALAWASRPAPRSSPDRTGWIAATFAGTVALAALAFAIAHRSPAERSRTVRLQISPPAGVRFSRHESPAVSPDGERVAFAAIFEGNSHLFVRELNQATAQRLPGSEGAFGPFWSPDGRHIGFVAEGRLRSIDLSGAPAKSLCDVYSFHGASWSPHGEILLSLGGELFLVPESGGEPRAVARPSGMRDGLEPESGRPQGRFWPSFLPDGRRYLYVSRSDHPEDQGICVASLDSSLHKRLVASDHNAVFSPSGHLLFVRGDALMAQSFDAGRLQTSGDAFPVIDGVALLTAPYMGTSVPRVLGAAYSVSANGVLVWQTGPSMESMQLTWFDRSGKKLGTLGEPGDYTNPALSPDQGRLAVSVRDARTMTRDLWVFDVTRGTGQRLTFDPDDDTNPTWSPDGKWIAFTSNRGGAREVYRKLANGSGEEERLLRSKNGPAHVESWSPNGRFVLYNHWPGGKPADLFVLSLSSGGDPTAIPFLVTDLLEDMGQFSPNGRWIAYRSAGSGRDGVYVKGVSAEGRAGGGEWQVSSARGLEPRWRGDGKELFYVTGSTLMAVEVETDGASFDAGIPRPLFEMSLPPQPRRNRFVVTRDGRRFLVNTPVEQASGPIDVLVNWLPAKR